MGGANCEFTCKIVNFVLLLFDFQTKYIAECIDEIKQELRQDNLAVKANAVAKLTYVRILRLLQFFSLQAQCPCYR